MRNGKITRRGARPFVRAGSDQAPMPAKLIPAATWAERRLDPPPSAQMLRRWCRDGKIPGAVRMGRSWYVPADAEYGAAAPTANDKVMRILYGSGHQAA